MKTANSIILKWTSESIIHSLLHLDLSVSLKLSKYLQGTTGEAGFCTVITLTKHQIYGNKVMS